MQLFIGVKANGNIYIFRYRLILCSWKYPTLDFGSDNRQDDLELSSQFVAGRGSRKIDIMAPPKVNRNFAIK